MALDLPLLNHGPASVVLIDDNVGDGLLDQRIAPAAFVEGPLGHPDSVRVFGVTASGQIGVQHETFAVLVILEEVAVLTLDEAAAVEDGIN